MNAAMNVGIVLLVIALDRFNDRARLLRSRRAVEINERMPVYLLMKNRELLPDFFDIH